MFYKVLINFFALVFIFTGTARAHASPSPEQICGKWASTEKNLIIEVYRENNTYKARIIWFNSGGDAKMMYRTVDDQNPDKLLRSRKVLGMSILKDLSYYPDKNTWEDGIVYDAKHGREWNASAYINKKGLLEVRGYWHFKCIGRTLTFKKVTDDIPELKSMRQDRILASREN
jgi:uncharacterized protein (DUF2147 family)